jgi:hypothetical protein
LVSGHEAVENVREYGFGMVPWGSDYAGIVESDAVSGESAAGLVLVRLRRGMVGETRRKCHLVLVRETNSIPDSLTALCGERICAGQAELLPEPAGMPCEWCVIRSVSA